MISDFYLFRKEVRHILGHSQLYPENSKIYKQDLMKIFEDNENHKERYLKSLTINEKQALDILFNKV